MERLVRRFAGDETGATAIEYALVASVVSIVISFGLSNLGTATISLYDFLVENLVPAGGAD